MPAPADQLQSQREALRRGLWRASLASVVVLLVVVALAIGVAWKAEQSRSEAERARAATDRAEAELWNAKLNEARARRIAGGPGARLESALAIRELVQRPGLSEAQRLALRQEAIAQLALVDVQIGTNWIENGGTPLSWNESFTRYVKPRADSPIAIYSYPSNEVVRQFEAYTTASLRRAVFSPCGELLAADFNDGEVRVWRVEDGEIVLATRGTSASEYFYPFFSPDSRLVGVIASRTNWQKGDALRLYDLTSRQVHLKSRVLPTFAAFSSDGRYLAAVETGMVKVLDVQTGGKITTSLGLAFDTHAQVAWQPRTYRLAITCGRGRLLVWDVFSGAVPKSLTGHPNVITDLRFSPDGRMLLSYGWDSTANLWEPISGRRLLAERRIGIRSISEHGQILAHISEGRREGVHTVLPRCGFRTIASTGGSAEPTEGVWIHPQSRLIAASYSDHGIRVSTFPEGEEVARFGGQWAQFTPDGTALLTFSLGEVRRYEIPARFSGCGNETEWLGRVIYKAPDGRKISKGTIAEDGKTLVIGENPNTVLFDLSSGRELKRFEAHAQNGSLSLNGEWLVTCKHQAFGSLLEVGTGRKIRSIRPMNLAEFSPDGRCLAVLDAAALRLFKTNTWEQICRIELEVGAGTSPGFAFSPDKQMFAVAYNRQDVRLYEVGSGRELATLAPPEPTPITGGAGLAFSSDTRWLLAARDDGDIVAWELPVIRAELAKLGLDWGGQPLRVAALGRTNVPTQRFPSAPVAAFLAAVFAIGAGLFIFIMQRRMIAGYERVEGITVSQREKLETAQDALVHSQKMRALGTLAAGIAHDFNNLLSVIRLSNQLAAEETKATGAAKDNMDAIDSAVAQGETIVQSMLGYSRAAAELDEEYSVAAALSETVGMLGKKFLSGIVLKFDVAPDLPRVRGARGRLEQMILNLVVNAAEAMSGHGTLRLAGSWVYGPNAPLVLQPRPAKRYIELLVSDSGAGIPEEVLPRIFEPFFTTKSAGATAGTGLGLSTVYTMAEQDGFGLGVETREGRGTTFRILIPLGAT